MLLVTSVVRNNCVYCLVEDLLDAGHLLATTFHVSSSHLSSDSHPLLLGNRGEALGFKKIDAGALCSKV
jgi:hypothetical protein